MPILLALGHGRGLPPLESRGSALVIYGHSNPGRKQELVTRMAPFNPKILESDLPPELEKALNDSLLAAEKAVGV